MSFCVKVYVYIYLFTYSVNLCIEELQGQLDYYLSTRLSTKVKLLRLPYRQGLIRARLHGAKNATGDVLVFLDAHCEVIKDWYFKLVLI